MQTTTTPSAQSAPPDGLRAGVLATLPILPAAAPFGMIYAVSALAAGLDPWQTIAMSLLVFAGAAQFTAAGLFAAGAGPLTLIITTLIVNARHLLMSASIARYLADRPLALRALLAFHLTDETYALGIARFLQGRGSAQFLLGANLTLYLNWQLFTLAGIALGGLIGDPAAYGLDLIFPLTFIGLLVPLLRERLNIIVAALAALIGVLGALFLPGSWYILLAGGLASALGALLPAKPVAPQTEAAK